LHLKRASTRLIVISTILIFLSVLNSIFILILVLNLKNYAEIINLSGRIRGNVQKVEKRLLNDKTLAPEVINLEKQIDNLIEELDKKEETFNFLLSTKDLSLAKEVQKCWKQLKPLINKKQFDKSYQISERCWNISDEITYKYQILAERNINYFIFLIVLNTLFIFGALILLLLLLKKDVKNRLEFKAHFDKLTKVYNRHTFEEIFNKVKENPSYPNPALIVLDIDNFKKINDVYGHNMGDKVLKEVSRTIRKHIRNKDIVARWGGEEFVILLPDADKNRAKFVAEKLRRHIKFLSKKFPFTLTASFGVSLVNKDKTLEEAFEKADKALYKAKTTGKNKVEVYYE